MLSAQADAFHSAITDGPVTDWEPFLRDVPDSLRINVLTELAILDLGQRYRAGERPLVEDYVRRFPELGPLDELGTKLIAEEYRCRLKAGLRPDPESYRRRFPKQFEELRGPFAQLESGSQRVANSTVVNSRPSPNATPASGVMAAALSSRTHQYEFIKRLGSGVFGEVWLARTAGTGIEKAIKKLFRQADEEASKRELRSLELTKNLRHSYLLTPEDFWVDENQLYIVMSVADGTLRGRMKECTDEGHPGIPEAELFGTLSEVAEAIDFLHDHKVMHRDLKPDNILLVHGHAKVADFGLARQQDAMIATMSMMAGSPAYMAPEVWAGDFGRSSDLYSLVVTYIELRQGKLPIKLGPISEVMFAHLEGQFRFESFIPDAERAVLLKGLSKDPQKRFDSCVDFVAELARVSGRTFIRPKRSKDGSKTAPVLKPLPGSTTVADTKNPPTQAEADPELSFGTFRPESTLPTEQPAWKETTDWTNSKPKPLVDLTAASSPSISRRKQKAKRSPARWIGALAALLVLGLLGSGIAYLLTGGTHSNPTPTSAESPPTVPATEPTPPVTQPTVPTTKPIVEPDIWKPSGAKKSGDETEKLTNGKVVYRWIAMDIRGKPVRFRLIPGGADNVAPFYISETKIPNGVFFEKSPEKADATAPAVGMTVQQAYDFAKDYARGRLPAPEEWDYAAGFHSNPANGNITRSGGVPWVNKPEPSPLRTDGTRDVNSFDLLDMAGNGREFTCGVLTERGTPPKIEKRLDAKIEPAELVVTRGRNFTLLGGLTIAHLARQRDSEPNTQLGSAGSPYTGFRILIAIP